MGNDGFYHGDHIENLKLKREKEDNTGEEEYLLDDDHPLLAILKLQKSRWKNSNPSGAPGNPSDLRKSHEGIRPSTIEESCLQ